jgi:hypothetical protein
MKQKLITLLVISTIKISFAQNFEGRVTYKNIFESKLENVTAQKFSEMIGSKQDYFIKNGNYLSVTNGQLSSVMLYNNINNIVYSKSSFSDTIACLDAFLEANKIVSSEITNTEEKVLGLKCKKLLMISSNGTTYTYYFNNKYKIDSKYFTKHNFNHWYLYLIKTGSLPLKTIIENKQFKMTTIATEVNAIKLEDSKFALPKDAIIRCK